MIRLGIIGAADIAYRRFLPALCKNEFFEYVGVASHTREKAERIQEAFQGEIFDSYEKLLEDSLVDAVYLALPPALHYQYGKKVLEAGKHLFMEKPFTTSLKETEELLKMAADRHLAVHENYMFLYHKQLDAVKQELKEGQIGEARLYRISFGFPFRGENDFRYQKELGGGALLDCGGYTLRLAQELLGEVKVAASKQYLDSGRQVDLYGAATVEGETATAQLAYGMDNEYRCELEVWGSKGILKAERIFTAPCDFPTVLLEQKGGKTERKEVGCDDQFYNSIMEFKRLIDDQEKQNKKRAEIRKTAELIEQIKGEQQ
ncbi:MAG: Gfo/Idh/MocA family protein [Lachnospiraceae bacterium]